MLHKGMSRSQDEEILNQKGDFVQIDYLTRFLREELSLDMKKYSYIKLAEIYEKMGMFDNATKMLDNAVLVSLTYPEKIKFHLKEAELYIRMGSFENADKAIRKATSYSNVGQRAEIFFQLKEFYLNQARIYEKELKRNNASKIYERLLQMRLNSDDEKAIKAKLLGLYAKLGKFKEMDLLKRGLNKKN